MKETINQLSRLKYSNRGGYKAPHKAIYLLSIIDMIEEGVINDRRFHIMPALINRFEHNWKRYVGNSQYFICNIWNPINYMEQDVVYRKFKAGQENIKPANIECSKEVYEYFEIPSKLWCLLQDEKSKDDIRQLLINTYIINNKTKSSFALRQLTPWIINMLYLVAI